VLRRNLSLPLTDGASYSGRWKRRIAYTLVVAAIVAVPVVVARRTLLLNVARTALNHDSALLAQERADGVAIVFSKPPLPWITPMKNEMNEIWEPIKANGVNYYMFGGPRTWLTPYSERSNPKSPYYQAWVGGYVIKHKDGSLPKDLQSLAWQVAALDQRSWLAAMGDPKPIADSSPPTGVGNIMIDGHDLLLWHGSMQSHSDLSAHPSGPLPTLIGMPPSSSWPVGVDSFHDVTLEGYFVCWVDTERRVSVVIYAVAASYAAQGESQHNNRSLINDELLTLMKSAKLEAVR
jgi:hypothetical protein